MKKMMKSLLMMALAVFVGTAFAADPVAIWTDFKSLTSGDYTLTADDACEVNEDGSITLGGAGLSLPVGGDAITVVMDVSGVPTTDGITVASVKMNGSYVSLKSTGTQLVQSWNNGGNYGTFDWTPAKRQTIVLGTMQSNPSGTTTWIDGEQKAANNGLMTSNGDLQNVYIGSYSGTGTDGTVTGSAAGMIVHSLRIYSTKLSTEAVVADYKTGNVDWVVSFDNNNRTIGWVNNWGGEANDSYVSTPNGQGYLIMNGYHPYYDYKLTKPSSIALYADISSVSEFTGNGAALIAFGKPGNSVEENSGNLVLSKVADGKVSVSRNGTQLVYIENADLAVAGSYHLFVFGINEDGKVFLSVDNEKKESEGSTTLPASGLQIGSMFTSIGSYVRAYNMVVDEVRGYEKYLSDAELASLREAFPAYSPNLVIVDANKNYSDLQIAESSNTTIIVNEGCTLTMNGEVTCNSLVIQGHGVVALDSEVGNPFGNVGRLTFDGITLQGGASAEKKITIANLISITSGKTLKTKGFLDFTNQNNTIASGATLEVVSGVTTFNLDRVGLSGTLKVAAGATFKNGTNDGPHYNATPTLDIAGTLEIINNARWSLPSRSTTTLREGAVLKGTATGDYKYSYDFFDGATITVLGNAEIKGCIGSHNGGTITFDIAKGKALTVSGVYDGGKNRGSPRLAVASSKEGEGVGTLVLAGANTYTGTTTINSGTTLVAASATALGTGNVTNSGTLELKAADTEATLAQVISGRGAVNVKAGTWALTAANGIDANVTVDAGATLDVSAEGAKLYTTAKYVNGPVLTVYGTLITRNWEYGESFGNLKHNSGAFVINGGTVNIIESFASDRIPHIGDNGATFNIADGATYTAGLLGENDDIGIKITGNGDLTINGGTLALAEQDALSANSSATVTVNGTLASASTRTTFYRTVLGSGKIVVPEGKFLAIGESTGYTGDATSGLSRFEGTLEVAGTFDARSWAGREYTIGACNVTVLEGGKIEKYSTSANAKIQIASGKKLSGAGTIEIPVTLADGATLAGAVTVTSDVTVEGAVNVTHATQAGDTVITCANAEAVAATLTGAPEGLKYVAKDGAVKLAAATVTVTLPAAPENMVWFYDGQPVENNAVTVNSGTSVTVTLKPAIDYIFSDNTTEKTFDLGEVIGDITGEIDIEDIVAVKPEVKIGEKSYATFASALAAAADGDTIVLEKDVICTEKPVFNNGGVVNVDVRDYVFVSTEQARVRNVASADGAVPSNNIKFVSGFGWEVYAPNTTEGVNFRVFPTLDAVIAYEPAKPNPARIYPYEDVKQDKDVTLRKYGHGTSSTICIDPEYDITWDLNGYTVLQESPTGNPLEACIRGKFTLKDSSDEKSGKWIAGACGVTNPESGWYGNGGPALYVLGEGEVILEGGTISIARNATSDTDGNEIVNSGGLIRVDGGKLNVNGATLQVDDTYGIMAWGGEIEINAGTFVIDPTDSVPVYASGWYEDVAVEVNSFFAGALCVYGNNVAGYKGASATVNVAGIEYATGSVWFVPSVGEGLMAFDGLVLEKGVAVVKSATSVKSYATFADALTAAQAGDTITLLADVTASDIIVLDKAITLDGNGKTLTSTAGRAINVSGADGVTIKNLTINASGERAINIIQNATNVTIDNVTATAANYTVNVAASAPNAVVSITDSTLNGLCTVNVSAEGAQVTVDNSTVNCNDNNATVGESYAALSLNKEAVGGTIAVTGTTINVAEGSDSVEARNGAENGTITIDGSTAQVNTIVAYITYPNSAAYHAFYTLQSAIDFAKAGDTITLLRDVNASEIITINKAITLDGNGKTLTYTGSNRAIEMPNNAEAKLNVTLKNLTVDCTASYCQRGINYNDDGALVLNNVTVKGTNVTYALNLPGYSDNCVVEITDSSLTGNIALNVWGENATINATNTTFTAVDNNTVEGYAAVKLNNDGTTFAEGSVINIVGGKIDVTGSACADTEAVSNGTATGDVNISDTTVVNGKIVEMVAVIRYAGGTSYSFYNLADAFAKAQAGDTIILLRDVTLSEILTINKAITLDGNGKTLTSTAARAINVSGADGVTIKNLTIDAKGERAINIIQGATNVTIDNVTATAANYTVNVAASAPNAVVAIKNSTLNGLCTVNVAAAGADVTVDNSTVNCNDNNTTAGESYAALSLNKDAVGGSIIATNTTVNVTEGSDSMKGRNSAEDGTVTINGSTDDVAVMVAAITYEGSDYYYTFDSLESAIDFAEAGNTITLLRDVTASEIITINKAITLDGNGKTLTSTAKRAINVSGADGVTIKNLTINASGERAINIIQNATNVTIDNVTATAANYTVNVAASAPEAVVAITNSTLNGLCTVNVAAAGAQVTVDDSTVNCNDNNATVGESYAALSLNKEAVGGSIVATDTTVNVTEGSDSMKGRNGAENGTVTINGSTDDVVVMVAAITYEGSVAYHAFASLAAAIEYAKTGDTITLLRDVNASEIITINKAITLDGNGKTLTYTGSNRAIEMPNNAEAKLNVSLKNLTVDCTASYCERGINYNDDGALTLEGVTVKGTNVTYALNLPGYSDNCVVEITDSSLTGNIALNVWGANSTITATNSEFVSVDNSNAEGYVAISLNNDGAGNAATGSVVTINGGKIIAKDENGAPSYAVRNSTATGEVIVSDTTEVVGKIVEPIAIITYGNNAYTFTTLQDAVDYAQAGETIKVIAEVNVDAAIEVAKKVTIDLNGQTVRTTENDKSGDGVFCVVAGGDLTINDSVGTGVINGVGGNNYNIAIWANGGKVTINGGNFTNVGATDNTDPNAHFDLIYVKNSGEVVINGGTFECETPAFTLNSHDTYKGVITVNGGTFVGFDPRNNAAETAGTTFMAAGKYTFAEGGNYIVVTPEDYILNGVSSDSATVNEIDSLLAGAVTVTKDGEKYVATATYTFKVTAVDTVNPEKSSYELTGGKLRPGKTVAVKYIDLATGTEAWEKPEADTVTFKLVIK